MGTPTASTAGYSLWQDTRHVGCDCTLELLELAEQLGLALGYIVECLDVVQLVGDAEASAGVHRLGSAFDVKQRDPRWIRLFRQLGAAVWPREGGEWEGNEHAHGVITCPHDELTAYQMTAYKRGYNGLGRGPAGSPYAGVWGYGGRDTEWRPATIPTRAQGLEWGRAELERLTMATAQEIAERVWRADIVPAPNNDPKNPTWGAQSYLRETFRLIERLAAADKARDDKLAAQLGSLAGVVQALQASPAGGLTFEQAVAAAEAGARAALDDVIDSATTTTTLEVSTS